MRKLRGLRTEFHQRATEFAEAVSNYRAMPLTHEERRAEKMRQAGMDTRPNVLVVQRETMSIDEFLREFPTAPRPPGGYLGGVFGVVGVFVPEMGREILVTGEPSNARERFLVSASRDLLCEEIRELDATNAVLQKQLAGLMRIEPPIRDAVGTQIVGTAAEEERRYLAWCASMEDAGYIRVDARTYKDGRTIHVYMRVSDIVNRNVLRPCDSEPDGA